MSVPNFILRFLPGLEDPHVVVAPFNPFSTESQIWLARNEPNYSPIFLDHQENVADLDGYPAPSESYLDLESPAPIATPEPQTGFLDDDVPSAQLSLISVHNSPSEAVLQAAEQAELADAVNYIPDIEAQPALAQIRPLVINGELASPSSSILEDYSDIVRGISPSNSSILSIHSNNAIVNPEHNALLEDFDIDMLDQELAYIQAHIPVPLNVNPHHNLVIQSPTDTDHAVVISDDDDPSDHSIFELPTPPGQYHRSIDDLFFPLTEITNTVD
jgi:hypothetical protein